MVDIGASKNSTARYGQYLAYRKINSDNIDTIRVGAINVQFGISSTASIRSIQVKTPIRTVEFHIVKADTPFLLCLADMDTLQVYYNNLRNELVTPSGPVLVVRRFGHLFLLWEQSLRTYIYQSFDRNPCFLTTTELRRLYRRFGYLSADRLYRLLEKADHDVDIQAVERLTKFCDYCQKHSRSPGRFKFNLQDDQDAEFNYSIYIDIMYIDGDPILHVIDEATRFQAAR
jgi:hypothetical protein